MLYETLSNLAAIGVATNLAWKISDSVRRWFGLSLFENTINNKIDDLEKEILIESILSELDYRPAREKTQKIKEKHNQFKEIEIKFTSRATSILAILFILIMYSLSQWDFEHALLNEAMLIGILSPWFIPFIFRSISFLISYLKYLILRKKCRQYAKLSRELTANKP